MQKIGEWEKCHLIQTWISRCRKLFFQGKWLDHLTLKISFNIVPVSHASFQKHLGIYLDEKLNSNYHIKEKMTKAMKGIGVIKRLSKILPWHCLLIIYKSFVWPHLDYDDIFYDQPNNKTLRLFQKLRLFNIMLLWPSWCNKKVHLKLNFAMN